MTKSQKQAKLTNTKQMIKPVVKFKCDTVPYDHGGTCVYIMSPHGHTGQGAIFVPSVDIGLRLADALNKAVENMS